MSQDIQATRSYFLWFFLGIITGGICMVIYYLLNFLDLDEHNTRNAHREKAPPTNAETWLMVLLCILIPGIGSLIAMYVKYSKLHDHLAVYQGAPNIPDGLSILLINIFLSWLTLGIITIYYEWKWQHVFNEHNYWHSRNQSQIPTR